MTQRFNMRNPHLFRRAICFSSTVSLLLLLGPSSLADYHPSGSSDRLGAEIQTTVGGGRVYIPPPNSQTSGESHTGGGVRGCGEDMAALAPRLHAMGQTVSTHPTFVWYVFSDDAEPIEFHLYRHQADGSLEAVLMNSIGPSNEGYMAYTLPQDEPDLSVGDTYLWQVVMYCDQNLEEVGRWTSADIKVVEPPANLAAELPDHSLQKAQAYAHTGLWYDAMAEVYDATILEEQTFRQNLLLDLADLEEQPDKEMAVDLSAQLRQIAEIQ